MKNLPNDNIGIGIGTINIPQMIIMIKIRIRMKTMKSKKSAIVCSLVAGVSLKNTLFSMYWSPSSYNLCSQELLY